MRATKLRFEKLENRRMMHDGHDGPDHPIAPDVTGDGLVDVQDTALVSSQLGTAGPLADANFDRLVDTADLALVQAHLGERPHGDDLAKQAEHLALLKLVPPAEATAVVVQSGNWSDPATWQNGHVPIAGDKIWVPLIHTLTVDGITPVIRWARIDGTLTFATQANTQLNIDTLVGTGLSKLEIATHPSFTTRITVTDGGPIDFSWDKFAISRGVIWHGATEVQGVAKTSWTRALPMAAGANQITVAGVAGWQIGDRLVIGGAAVGNVTRYTLGLVARDDLATITAIEGNVVTLATPLQYAHAAVEGQNPVVLNLTRNVVIESAATDITRRGHVMFMHNPHQQIGFVEFNRMGRTNKAVILTDPDGAGNGLANPRGRYAVHFHRTGTASQPARVDGISINDSPGWGLVNHDSNVVAEYCASYNVFGAHFVSELGNELGLFAHNAAVYSKGSGLPIENTPARRAVNDAGHTGEGFWLEGGGVQIIGNVAVGMRSAGYTFFSTDQPVTCRDNVTLQSTRGLIVWANRFPLINPHKPTPTTVFAEFTGNFFHSGVKLGYSGFLEFRDNVVPVFDIRLNPLGFSHTAIAASDRFINNRVTGFNIGMQIPSEGENVVQGGYYDNLLINLKVYNTQQNRYRKVDISGVTFGPSAAWNVYMGIDFFSYSLDAVYPIDAVNATRPVPDWRRLFAADRTAAVGPASQVTLNGVPLFFEEQGADFAFGARLTRFPAEIRYEPDGVTLATGASLNARGKYVGSVPLPAGVQYHLPKVRGVLVTQA